MELESLSRRAAAVIAKAGIVDLAAEDAAERLLAVAGCGRKTLQAINAAVEAATGTPLGGFDRVIKGYSGSPTITTEEAARIVGVEPTAFVVLARAAGVAAKRRKNGRIWSEWDIARVRRPRVELPPPSATLSARVRGGRSSGE